MGRGATIMSSMRSVVEWVSGQQFESKNLAAGYFQIPVSLINKSIKTGEEVVSKRGRRLKFANSLKYGRTSTVLKSKTTDNKTLNFGKHKHKQMRDIPTDYLQWVYDNVSRCPKCVEIELKKRKGELI